MGMGIWGWGRIVQGWGYEKTYGDGGHKAVPMQLSSYQVPRGEVDFGDIDSNLSFHSYNNKMVAHAFIRSKLFTI